MRPLYFDYNATTPVDPRVLEAMLPYLEDRFGNPGSIHPPGLAARRAVDKAREQVAALLNCASENVVFTSGATESNNIVLFGMGCPKRGKETVTSAIEHPSVLEPAKELARRGVTVHLAPCGPDGRVGVEAVAELLSERTGLVSLMLANNETGVLQPVAEVAALCRARGIFCHTDASQAMGKIKVDVQELGVDALTVAGHKMYAPKGVGALYIRPGAKIPPRTFGGGHERGMRSGTENVPYVVALGEAADMVRQDLEEETRAQKDVGRLLEAGLRELMGDRIMIYGEGAERLPNTLCAGFKGLTVGDILSGLLTRDVALAGGAACHASSTSVSHVIQAMGIPMEYAAGTIRFSWGRGVSAMMTVDLLKRLAEALEDLGAIS